MTADADASVLFGATPPLMLSVWKVPDVELLASRAGNFTASLGAFPNLTHQLAHDC